MFDKDQMELTEANSLMGFRKFTESVLVNVVIVMAIFIIVWWGFAQVVDPLRPV